MTEGHSRGAPGGSGEARRALWDLVTAATVRIHDPRHGYSPDGPTGGFLGSGYFIAPSWVLTCAHVVRHGEGARVTVIYETGPGRAESAVAGEVAATLPRTADGAPRDNWPAPDLALVRLLERADHDCVYVTERPAAFYDGDFVLYSGWAVVDGVLSRVNGTCTVQGSLGWAGPEEQMRLGGDRLPPGVSGGPVVDPVRGEVIGVVKSRLDRGPGGTSIGVEQLRALPVPEAAASGEHDDLYQAVFHAHDRYHMDRLDHPDPDRAAWADVQSALGAPAPRPLSTGRRTQLLGRLAELPPPVSTRALLDQLDGLLGGHTPIRHPAPRAWRDGLGLLYDMRTGDGALELVLDYAMGALGAERPFTTPGSADAERALWKWIRWSAVGLSPRFRSRIARQWYETRRPAAAGEGARATPPDRPPRPAALLELRPRAWEPDHYDWQVSVVRPDGEVLPVREDSHGTGLADLPDRLAAPLGEAFRWCDEPGQRGVLQLAVPPALLGLEVDAWRLPPDGPPLGVARPVVVRCTEHEPQDVAGGGAAGGQEEREARWRWTHLTGIRAEILDCEDGMRQPVPAVTDLRTLSYGTVPVLCRYRRGHPEAAEGLVRLVRGGFGVALWRRHEERTDTVCAEFHRRAAGTVVGAPSAERLPELVHQLRAGVFAGRAETYWSAGIALLYDDPRMPLPGAGELLEAP